MILFKRDNLEELQGLSASHESESDALEIYRDLINDVLTRRGLDAAQAYKNDLQIWMLPARPAPLVLRLVRDEENDFLECVMRLAPLPAKNLLAFYRALLEANMRLSYAAFGVTGDGVFLHYQRPLAALDEDELDDVISTMIQAADDEWPPLLEQFIFGASILR
jgi:hypothetical protein